VEERTAKAIAEPVDLAVRARTDVLVTGREYRVVGEAQVRDDGDAPYAPEAQAGVRRLLYAAFGCNSAWGIIDGVMYVMNCMTVRAEKARLIDAIQRAPDARAALDVIRGEIEPRFETLTEPENRDALSRSILRYLARGEAPKVRVTRDDLYGALASF